jgi:protein SCO1/2
LSADRQGRPSRWPLVGLLAVALVATPALVLVALGEEDAERPAATAPARAGPFRGSSLPRGIRNKPAPAFKLTDARGGTLATSELRGRPYVVTFLFTDCPDVCPLIGQELGQALRLLGGSGDDVAIAAVSVDPEGDTPEAVRAWLRRHRLPANFHYLLGDTRELRPVWRSYFAAPQRPDTEESLHTASIWLIDAQGRWRTKFSGGVPVDPRDIAHDLRVLLREARG